MSVGGEPGHLHPVATQRNGFRYFFYDKHHGRGGPAVARWSPDLSEDEEFAIFDQADLLDLSDANGNLYDYINRNNETRSYSGRGHFVGWRLSLDRWLLLR